jgi:hypothetical protein
MYPDMYHGIFNGLKDKFFPGDRGGGGGIGPTTNTGKGYSDNLPTFKHKGKMADLKAIIESKQTSVSSLPAPSTISSSLPAPSIPSTQIPAPSIPSSSLPTPSIPSTQIPEPSFPSYHAQIPRYLINQYTTSDKINTILYDIAYSDLTTLEKNKAIIALYDQVTAKINVLNESDLANRINMFIKMVEDVKNISIETNPTINPITIGLGNNVIISPSSSGSVTPTPSSTNDSLNWAKSSRLKGYFSPKGSGNTSPITQVNTIIPNPLMPSTEIQPNQLSPVQVMDSLMDELNKKK